MQVFPGFLLVLLTWGFLLLIVMTAGALPSLLLQGSRGRVSIARVSLWWGFAILTIAVLLVSVVSPLRQASAGAALLCLVIVLGVLAWTVRRSLESRRGSATGSGSQSSESRIEFSRLRVIVRWALLAPVIYLAMSALGALTNYDSGLYHLGAVSYAGDYSAIPGLANLYFPLGYANAEIPLAAVLGNGPWDGQGFRLLNGFMVFLAVAELFLRTYSRKWRPGFFVLLSGLLAGLVPFLFMADAWVTSPTSDSMVFLLTVVTSAYLADAIAGGKSWWRDSATAVILAGMTVVFRPTMIMFAAAVLALVVFISVRRRKSTIRHRRAGIACISILLPLAAIANITRDYFLSGWIQYPLSLFHFNVAWLAPAADSEREATLGFARDPNDLWGAAQGWGWVGAWFARLPHQWEFVEFVGIGLALVVVAVLATRAGVRAQLRRLTLVLVPSVVMVVWWWTVTPPSFRFAWGPVFSLVTIPLGWIVWRICGSAGGSPQSVRWVGSVSLAGFAFTVVALSIACLGLRLHPGQMTEMRTWRLGVEIAYASTPIRDAPVEERKLNSGLAVISPTESDQCWLNFPLCTPDIREGVRLRGQGLQEGFIQ